MEIAHRIPKLKTKVLRDMESIPWTRQEIGKTQAIEKRSANNHFLSKGKPTKFSDDQIIEIRALNQFAFWSYEMLMKRYSATRKEISRICEYYNRTKLVPSPDDIPVIN